jgi:hypothetical protein
MSYGDIGGQKIGQTNRAFVGKKVMTNHQLGICNISYESKHADALRGMNE